ncbi:MAG: insulinase family protein [Lachnospiraceae bacterium]
MSQAEIKFITDLTYESYLEFYHTYYHPSNSYIYLYGDLDMEKALNWMDHEYLSHYDKKRLTQQLHLKAVQQDEGDFAVLCSF